MTNEEKVAEIEKLIDQDTGIIVLTKRNTLHVVRELLQHDADLKSGTLFKILRKYEFEGILKNYFGYLPQVTSFKYYDCCFELFKSIEIKTAQNLVLQQLKKRAPISQEQNLRFKQIPVSLKALVYFAGYQKKGFALLNNFLNTKLGEI